jgi:hypothetical protein
VFLKISFNFSVVRRSKEMLKVLGVGKIAQPKASGGLGIRDANISLLGKLVWDILQTLQEFSEFTAPKSS